WRGEKVFEISIANNNPHQAIKGSFFLTADKEGFVGYEFEMNGKVGYLHYTHAVANPKLPNDLGKEPKTNG
ncbi:MAG TPA: hypothetical protein VG820_08465, partial [Fimbriimonadaceae bacterium]|nr:hypothetical protein [Fimbriimonadaceae bacterium]